MPALSLDVESSSMSYYLSLVERRVAEFYHNIDRTILIAVATPVPDSQHKQTNKQVDLQAELIIVSTI